MNISPLLSTAAGIRDEKARYANTANRVGTLLYNMCLAMADTDATASDGQHMAQNLGQWLTTHDNLTTLDALNAALDAMNVDTPQGLHCFKCFGIPLFVTFANLNVGDSVLMQTIQGSITFNSAKTSIASINTTGNLTIAVRYYQGGKWGSWNTPMTPIEPPTVQTSYNGTTNNYIYSNGTDVDKNCVASCNWWTYSRMVEYMSAGKDGVLMIILIMPMIMKHIKHHNICYPIWVVIMVRVIKTDFCHGSGDNE